MDFCKSTNIIYGIVNLYKWVSSFLNCNLYILKQPLLEFNYFYLLSDKDNDNAYPRCMQLLLVSKYFVMLLFLC